MQQIIIIQFFDAHDSSIRGGPCCITSRQRFSRGIGLITCCYISIGYELDFPEGMLAHSPDLHLPLGFGLITFTDASY
jgi:hypothetical protein